MKIVLLFFLTGLSNFSFGQFAIIFDKDGYSNVHSNAEMGKIYLNQLFLIPRLTTIEKMTFYTFNQ